MINFQSFSFTFVYEIDYVFKHHIGNMIILPTYYENKQLYILVLSQS